MSQNNAMTQKSDDTALIEAIAQRRDRDAFTILFERHQQAAYSLSLHITGSREAAEEAIQDAMLQVWLSAPTFEARGSVRGWILRIVARQSLKAIRSNKKQRNDIKRATEVRQDAALQSPSESIEQKEILATLRRVLDDLPIFDRQLVAMHYGGGLTQEEIGKALSTPQRTVSFRISKALEEIRSNLARAGFATALPILLTEHLNEALCSGATVPSGLAEQIVTHAFNAHPRNLTKLARSGAAAKSGGWLMAGAFATIVAAAAAVIWWMLQGGGDSSDQTANETSKSASGIDGQLAPHTVSDPAATLATQPVIPAVLAPPAILPAQPIAAANADDAAGALKDVVWNFADGPAKDIDVLTGSWKWELITIHAGHMTVAEDSYVVVRLPLEFPLRPMVIKIKATTPLGLWHMAAYWLNGVKLVPHSVYQQKMRVFTTSKTPTPRAYSIYCIDQYMVNQIVLEDKPQINLIREYRTAIVSRRIALYLKNVSVDEISVHSLRPEEMPDSLRNIKSVINQLGEPADVNEHGEQSKPAAK